MEIIKPGTNINFTGRRMQAIAFSGLLILLTIVSLFLRGGPNYGIDFAGGILVQVRFDKATTPADIKKTLAPLGLGDALVQNFGQDKNEFLVRGERQGLKLEGLANNIRKALTAKFGKDFEVRRVEMVGPKVGNDLRQKALLAIFFAILMIAVYISGRFEQKWGLAAFMAGALVAATLLVRGFFSGDGGDAAIVPLIITALVITVGACWMLKLRYALGAIVALIHDVIITVGVFSALDKEFTLATVAALLTIIGYSLNDTIIVFDRIRENLKKSGKQPLDQVINQSVNQTLSRTLLTSGTTLVVLICLYIFGGGVIEDFALALLIGVVVGTYSSIFVASPMLLFLPEGAPAIPGTGAKAAPEPIKVKGSAAKAAKAKKRKNRKGGA